MAIKPLRQVTKLAKIQLKKYQSGELVPVRTGREWLDDIFGGLIPMDIVTIAGMSGGGKSFELQRIKNFVMNKENNPNAEKYIWLSNSLEMKIISNIIRDLNISLKKSKKKILTEEFTEDEKVLVNDYFKNSTDARYYINEEAMSGEDWEKEMRAFLALHTDKEAVFIDIDHIALQKDKNGNKKATVDFVVESINSMKKDFPNSYWILLSQLNRNILERIREKDIMSMPNRGDVFQSDSMFFISDYLYVTHNPNRLGISQFSKVNTEVYEYVAEHLIELDKGKSTFDTLGKIFYIVLKMREADILYRDIFIEEVEFEGKSKYKEPKDDLVPVPMFTPKPIDLSGAQPNFSITDESDEVKKSFVLPDIWDKHEEIKVGEEEEEDPDMPF
jgi:replicative DNA helicase